MRRSAQVQWLESRARLAGLSLEVKDYAPGWRTYTFLRHGDAMCVAVLYGRTSEVAKVWLDGYEAAVSYPPDPDYHVKTVHPVKTDPHEAGLP